MQYAMLPAVALKLEPKMEQEPMPISTMFTTPLLKENCMMNSADNLPETALKRKSRLASPSTKPTVKVEEATPEELALMAIINGGTFEDLKTLKGLGNKSATAIIQYRKQNGVALERADDLVKHVGLTRGTISKLIASFGMANQ